MATRADCDGVRRDRAARSWSRPACLLRALSVAGRAEPPRLLLEGRPGSGTTTAVARLVDLLRRERFALTGFSRASFASWVSASVVLETLDGRYGVLAHVGARGGPRVGRYRCS